MLVVEIADKDGFDPVAKIRLSGENILEGAKKMRGRPVAVKDAGVGQLHFLSLSQFLPVRKITGIVALGKDRDVVVLEKLESIEDEFLHAAVRGDDARGGME